MAHAEGIEPASAEHTGFPVQLRTTRIRVQGKKKKYERFAL